MRKQGTESDLDARIRLLEDVEEIKKLKYEYCYAFDEGRIKDMVACFAENCIADYGVRGSFTNKADIEIHLSKTREILPFSNHMLHNPIINVDGDHATGKWYFEVPSTRNGEASWLQGKYDVEEYTRENGKWKIKCIKADMAYITRFHTGWVKEKIMDLGSNP